MNEKLSSDSFVNLIYALCHQIVSEEHLDVLLEKITFFSKTLSNADGITLYLAKDEKLQLHYIYNQSLNIEWKSDSKKLAELNQLIINGKTKSMFSVKCFVEKKVIHIKNVDKEKSEPAIATRLFDAEFNYKTKSILNIPILGHNNNILGVIQFINALNKKNKLTSFNDKRIKALECLAIFMGSIIESRL